MRYLMMESVLAVFLLQGVCNRDSKVTSIRTGQSIDSPLLLEPVNDPGDRFSLAGIDDPEEARRFLGLLQGAVAGGDSGALASVVRYPFTIWSRGKPKRIYRTRAELTADFERVFTSKVLQAIRRATFGSLFVNWQGVMIGDGEIWFDKREGGIGIKAING